MPVAAGLLALYVPTYVDLSRTLWRSDELAHGPLIALAVAVLFWMLRDRIFGGRPTPQPGAGAAVLAAGLAMFVIGRSQQIPLLEVGSQLPVYAGLLLALRGRRALAAAWFPLCFMLFLLPLPGVLLEGVNALLKEKVSAIAETALYHAGVPVARQGVLLAVGQYRLFMADACSGLHSMVSLCALGVLFAYLMNRADRWHNALLLASIVPIAFTANLVRVLVLALATFHFGDGAAQGALHMLTGALLFVVALGALFAIDAALARFRPAAATAA